MASSAVTINNQIRYDVSDDKMEKLITYLDAIGQKVNQEDPLKGAWKFAKK